MGYFEEALSNFVSDFNYGGAIRHLTDLGYSAASIKRKLKIPFDTVRIQEIQYKHLLERGMLITEEQLLGKGAIYARNLDEYPVGTEVICKEYPAEQAEKILVKMMREHGGIVYVDFPFGRMGEMKKQKVLDALKVSEQSVFDRIPWQRERTFLKGDESFIRMSTRLNSEEVLYTNYYFTNPAVTVISNANEEYRFFTLSENVVK